MSNSALTSEQDRVKDAKDKADNKQAWADFQANGVKPWWAESDDDFATALCTEFDAIRLDGVPIIHAIFDDGSVHIEADENDLRRVVLQPSGDIAKELLSPAEAAAFVETYNSQHASGECWAEAIDYVEAYKRGRAAGY